jgi:enoyl-CoA hydratase/carnithine racemase
MLLKSVEGNVTTVTLRHPPVNAISDAWLAAFNAALDELAQQQSCSVLHIRSDQKVFCAGADLKEMRQRMDAPDGADRTQVYVSAIQRLYRRIEQLPQVTLAEIGGAAMGGGLELALACDLRIVAVEAKVGLPEARLGLIPGAGGTQRLTQLCGPAVAKRLILGAEVVDGAAARELGIVQWAVPRHALAAQAANIVQTIAALPAPALSASKACIAAADGSANSGRGYSDEVEFTRALFDEPETRRRVQLFIAESLERSQQRQKGAA